MTTINDTPVFALMTKDLITINGDTRVSAVKNLFETHGIHHLPVVDADGHLQGIISQLDIYRMTHCIDLFRSKANELYNQKLLDSLLASEIMTTNLTVLTPDASLKYAVELFKRNQFHAIPIVEGAKLIGILTPLDIIRFTLKDD